MSIRSDTRRDRSLWAALTFSAIGVAVIGTALLFLFWDVKPARIEPGLTNVATIGGIVSGLSLSGTAVLTLSGRYKTKMLSKYGPAIRIVLFGGFSALVASSMLCAVSVIWINEFWVKPVLAYTIPLMLLTLISTALLINSAFAWQNSKAPTRPGPYQSVANPEDSDTA